MIKTSCVKSHAWKYARKENERLVIKIEVKRLEDQIQIDYLWVLSDILPMEVNAKKVGFIFKNPFTHYTPVS